MEIYPKRLVFLHRCAERFELPSDTSTMGLSMTMPISRVMIIIILLHTAIVGKCILPGDHWHNGSWETELCQGVYSLYWSVHKELVILWSTLHTAKVGKNILPRDHWHNWSWETKLC